MNNDSLHREEVNYIRKCFAISYICILFFFIVFWYQAKDQLKYEDSKNNIVSVPATNGVGELSSGIVVTQRFVNEIEMIDSFEIQWATFYRTNTGNVYVELVDPSNGDVLCSDTLRAEDITEALFTSHRILGQTDRLSGKELEIRLSSDSAIGSAVAPLMSNVRDESDSGLAINGEPVNGRLCFSAKGFDKVWFGFHYIQSVSLISLVIGVWLLTSYLRYHKLGKTGIWINLLLMFRKYRFLIKQLVERDFKTRYKKSILGVLWSVLSPLLTMIVQYFVFSTIFKTDIPQYGVYLLIGITVFNFFSEACGTSLVSIVINANLINKVYVPKYIYPLTKVLSSLINFLISLIPLIVVAAYSGLRFTKATPLSFIFVLLLMFFSVGVGLILSCAMVFFRDVQHLWGIFVMIWMYATPIFYPETILPDKFRVILSFNPLYYYFKAIRQCVINGTSPGPRLYLYCTLVSFVMLGIGAWVFGRNQNKFILYI